jgi:hypothetical protein
VRLELLFLDFSILTLRRTCVIILDSLGGRHTRVLNVLGQYLQLEAREKKGIPLEESRKSFGKQAQVRSLQQSQGCC